MNQNQINIPSTLINAFFLSLISSLPALILNTELSIKNPVILTLMLYLFLNNFILLIIRQAYKYHKKIKTPLIIAKMTLSLLLVFTLLSKTTINIVIILLCYELYTYFLYKHARQLLNTLQYLLMTSLFNGLVFNLIITTLAINKFFIAMITPYLFSFFLYAVGSTIKQRLDAPLSTKKNVLLQLGSLFSMIAFLIYLETQQQLRVPIFSLLLISLLLLIFLMKTVKNNVKKELLLNIFMIALLVLFYKNWH